MGKIKGGIQGKVSGKVGNVIFYESGDMNLTRSLPKAPPKFTGPQKANHTVFGLKQNWLKPITAFLLVGCKNNIPHMGGTALAMQYLSANAVSGKGESFQIHPEKMLVSMGDLPGTPEAAVTLEGSELEFSWDPQVDRHGSQYDQVLVLAYDVEQGEAFSLLKGHFRKDGSLRMQVSTPGHYHCYLGFLAEDSSRQSNSQYLGAVEVP